jgi:hypothetical protein
MTAIASSPSWSCGSRCCRVLSANSSKRIVGPAGLFSSPLFAMSRKFEFSSLGPMPNAFITALRAFRSWTVTEPSASTLSE